MIAEESGINLQDQYLSCFIEPVKQTVFQFNIGHQSMNMRDNRHRKNNSKDKEDNGSWKPVLQYKKLYSQPKFILSLQRKKARIISGIRDRQVQPQEKKMLGLVGSKIKHKSYRNTSTRIFLNSNIYIENFVQNNNQKLLNPPQKRPKTPNMNFSLLYMTERKKLLDFSTKCTQKQAHKTQYLACTQKQRQKSKLTPRVATASCRQKGSDTPYLHMIINQSMLRKSMQRPRTSCTSERYRANGNGNQNGRTDRPKSQIC